MPISDMFNMLDSVEMGPTNYVDNTEMEMMRDEPVVSNWEQEMEAFKSQPAYYHSDLFMSPYVSNHWESGSPILKTAFDESRLPPLSDKIDPNRIFNSDIAALRALANDQSKRIKLFDRVFVKSLTDKNKYGLTEEDVAAFQALTAACNAITSINKEQINIKKNIAELRIKQNSVNSPSMGPSSGPRMDNNMDIGRSVLDSLFESSITADQYMSSPPQNYTSETLDSASNLLDDIVAPSLNTQYEAMGVKPYVVVGDNTTDVEFRAFDPDGNIINDYKLPTSTIVSVDLGSKTAVDNFNQTYDIKRASEL